jgi:hypothetical protein
MKPGSPIMEIHHHAGVEAANTVKVKHCELINFNALQGSALNHQNISPKILIKNFRGSNRVEINARRTSLKVRPVNFLKLYRSETGPLPAVDGVPVQRSQHPDPGAQETYMFLFQSTLA